MLRGMGNVREEVCSFTYGGLVGLIKRSHLREDSKWERELAMWPTAERALQSEQAGSKCKGPEAAVYTGRARRLLQRGSKGREG